MRRGVLRGFYLLIGALSAQNSVLKWAADHRLHHAHCDKPKDPHSIQRGFWGGYIGWVLFESRTPTDMCLVADLYCVPLVPLHRLYVPLWVLMAGVVPAVCWDCRGEFRSVRARVCTAYLTLGEGYHNSHHGFMSDHRNGVRWFHFDPTKWLGWSMARLGLAGNPPRVAKHVIESVRGAVVAEALAPATVATSGIGERR